MKYLVPYQRLVNFCGILKLLPCLIPLGLSLNLYTEDQSNHVKDLAWTRSSNLGDRWVQGLVSLSSPDAYRIILEALYSGNPDGSIALDDTMVAEGGLCNGRSMVVLPFFPSC